MTVDRMRARSRALFVAVAATVVALFVSLGVTPATAADGSSDSYGALSSTSVSGTILGFDGAPLSDVLIAARATTGNGADETLATASTGADGVFSLSFGTARSFVVTILPAAGGAAGALRANGTVGLGVGGDVRTFEPGASADLGLVTLGEGTTVSGSVTLTGLATALAAEVRIADSSGAVVALPLTVQAGLNTWSLALAAGEYTAELTSAAAALSVPWSGSLSVGTTAVSGIDFATTVSSGTLGGRVTDASGVAFAGSVEISSVTTDTIYRTRAAVDGTYRVANLRPGTYVASVVTAAGSVFYPDFVRGACAKRVTVSTATQIVNNINVVVGKGTDCVALPGAPEPTSSSGRVSGTAYFYWRTSSADVAAMTGAIIRIYDTETGATPVAVINSNDVAGWMPAASISQSLSSQTSLAPGRGYWWSVAGLNEFGEGAESWRSTLNMPVRSPSAVQNVQVVPGDQSVTVSWDPPASDGGEPVKYRLSASGADTVTISDTTHTITGLQNGGSYTILVYAVNSAGLSPYVLVSSSDYPKPGRAPDAPVWALPSFNGSKLSLSWRPPADAGGRAITHYSVTAEPGGLSKEWRPGDASSYIIYDGWSGYAPTLAVDGLQQGTTYTFSIRAHNELGASATLTVPVTTPAPLPAPKGLTATPEDGRVQLSWEAPPGAVATTEYVITSRPGGDELGATTATLFDVWNLTNGVPYSFEVRARNSIGLSQPAVSGTVTPRTFPRAVEEISAVVGDGIATVTWKPPADNGGSPVTGYVVIGPDGQQREVVGTSATFSGLANGSIHYVSVVAVNAAGWGDYNGAHFTPRTKPSAVRSVDASPHGAQTVVTWSWPDSDGGAPISSYQITASPGGASKTVSGGEVSASFTGLSPYLAYTFAVTAHNEAGASPVAKTTKPVIPGEQVSRAAGGDRYSTSAAISRASFAPGVTVAYIASGRSFADALSGAPVAAGKGGPVLLVDTDAIPAAVATELSRLKPAKIVVLGGTGVVSKRVASLLSGYTSGAVERLAGSDRYGTSAAVSGTFAAGVPVVYLASGANFPDALSGAPAAGKAGGPMLLVAADSIPPVIEAELKRLKPAKIVVLGGAGVVSPAVVSKASVLTGAPAVRQAGGDRYATSANVSAATYAPGVPIAFVASGSGFADALSGAAAAGLAGSPVLLTQSDGLPAAIAAELYRLKPERIVVLGGSGVVSNVVADVLRGYVSQ